MPTTVDYVATFSSTEEFLSNCNSSFKIIRVPCSEIKHHTYIQKQSISVVTLSEGGSAAARLLEFRVRILPRHGRQFLVTVFR